MDLHDPPPDEMARLYRESDEMDRRARRIERGWCRGALALDRKSQRVDPSSRDAVAWCSSGALIAAGAIVGMSSVFGRLEAAIGREAYSIPSFNDAQETVEPVLAAFDRAIATGGR